MINQINNIAYITNNLMDRQVNELMNSYINKYMDTDIMEQGTDRRNGTRKGSSKNKWKKKEEKSPSKTTLPKVFSLWRGYWQLRVKIFSFPATTEKKKEKLKEKMDRVKWIGARAGRGSGGTSQSAGGRASGQLALLLSREEEQRCGPRSYSAAGGRPSLSTLIFSEKEDYGYKLSALL